MDPMLTDLSRFEALQSTGNVDPYSRFDKIKRAADAQQSGGGATRDDQRLREVSVDFESLFLKQMLDSMRKTLNEQDDLIQGGMAQNIFEDMLYDEYSRLMAKSGDFGIADMLYRQFTNAPAPLNG